MAEQPQSPEKEEKRPTRPNLVIDKQSNEVTFRTTAERGAYLQDLLKTGVVPDHFKSVPQLENAYRMLNQLGLPWQMYLNKTYYVGAQLTLMTEPLLAACRATGQLEYLQLQWYDEDNKVMSDENVVKFKAFACVCRAKRREETREVMFGFTMDEAKAAGLVDRNRNYKSFTKDMLMWRAMGRVLKVLFTEICGGIPVQGVDDLVPVTDEQGRQIKTESGERIYRKRQAETGERLKNLLGS